MSFNKAPESLPTNVIEWCRRIAQVVNGAMSGRTNNTDVIILDTGVTTTTVTLASGRLGNNTMILFEPTTAHAANELYSKAMWVSNKDPANNQFTITHNNAATTDRTFYFALIG